MHPQVASFGSYRVRDYLGSGGFSHVYEVEGSDGAVAAAKWLKKDAPRDGRERFVNEAWALRLLDHPSIPRFIDDGEHDGSPFIVMTLARGTSLRKTYTENAEEGGAVSQAKMLAVADALLAALEHMHARGITHRDVKDDNVIVNASASDVMLVDLGMCKGPNQPADASTFWNAGGSRFSPPEKLKHAALAEPSHDVFAVGVLGYLMLTNKHPWTVGNAADRGKLEDAMRRLVPEPIHRINNLVHPKVSEFFAKLYDTNDASRPSASDARASLKVVRQHLEERVAGSVVGGNQRIKFPRVIRDPLHGDILMTEVEWQILNTREFQRLRWIRQLGTSRFVYPGAEHTRFNHSLGTMYVAYQILRRIEERHGERFEPEEFLVARLYALVHDLTHIAYGHTFEDELQIFERHDQNHGRLTRLLFSDKSEAGNILRLTEYGQVVLGQLDVNSTVRRHTWLQELVESPAGADVLDYIDRDALFCGLDHRVDSAIYRRFTISGPTYSGTERRHLLTRLFGRHGFRLDADFAIETILRERLALFMKVYTHPVKVAVGAMLGRALWDVLKGSKQSKLDERKIELMGDDELLVFLRNSERPLARSIATQIFNRQYYKPAFRSRALAQETRDVRHYNARQEQLRELRLDSPGGRTEVEAQIAKKAGIKPGDVIVYFPGKAPGLQRVRHFVEEEPGKTRLRDEVHDPHLRMYAAHLGLWTAYVFIEPGHGPNTVNRVAEASRELLSLENELHHERSQLVLELLT